MKLSNVASCCSPAKLRVVDGAQRQRHAHACWKCSGARARYRAQLGSLGAIFHTVTDVIQEKQRVWAVVNQTVATWNQCSANLTSAAAAQLGTDFAAWWTNWSNFANNGQEYTAFFAGVEPDVTDWDIMQTIEQQLVGLTKRINAMCRAGLPGPTPPGTTSVPTIVYVAVAGLVVVLLTVVVAE